MKIALFGATGKTGRIFLLKALEKGHHVTALVRNPSKLQVEDEKLNVVKGSLLNKQDIHDTINGAELVVNLSGHVKDSPPNLQLSSMEHIVSAMRENGVQRIITLTGGGVRDHANDQPKFIDKLIVFIMKNLAGKGTRNALLDGIAHIDYLKNQKDIEHTVVRGPMLKDEPAKGKIEIGHVGTVQGIKLTREDLAEFIVNEVDSKDYINQMPFVTNGK
ncbi:MAG: NAD(P)-dependent oxidoreductase [Fluviicola sp.]